ncbi:hypothetical protein FJ251_12265 [bacterium]|nr:hypothetical protein [bacterium]
MRSLLLVLTLSLLLAASQASANMAGGTTQLLGPGTAMPGDEVTFIFEVRNGSSDGEATSAVQFRFPETFRVLEGWFDDRGQNWDFAVAPYGLFTERIIFYDIDNDFAQGEILPGQVGNFYVRVAINPNADCGIYDFHWKQFGDNQGKHLHYVLGTLPYDICGIATETTSFSSIKSLY